MSKYGLSAIACSHPSLKEEHLSSVKAVHEGKDVFVWLPTGFGKSLCYQILPFVFDHKLGLIGTGKSIAVLVVSPLVSPMVGQVQKLRSRGAKAASFHPVLELWQWLKSYWQRIQVSMQQDSLLFCAPESLMKSRWREALGNPLVSSRIVAVIVDEAYCVSKW